MYPYLHIAAGLHKYRTTEMHKAAERARRIADLAPKTHSYCLWGYRLTRVKKVNPHVQHLTTERVALRTGTC